jgi:hypothetical protein
MYIGANVSEEYAASIFGVEDTSYVGTYIPNHMEPHPRK